MRAIWIVVVLAACDRRGEPAAPPAPPAVAPRTVAARPVADLIWLLESRAVFVVAPYGDGQPQSGGELLVRELARAPDSLATFERFAQHPQRALRLYAYWALRTLAPARAAALRSELETDMTLARTQLGCTSEEVPTRELLAEADRWPMGTP